VRSFQKRHGPKTDWLRPLNILEKIRGFVSCVQSVRCGRATKVIKKQTQIIGIIIVVVHWQARDIDAKQDTHIF